MKEKAYFQTQDFFFLLYLLLYLSLHFVGPVLNSLYILKHQL